MESHVHLSIYSQIGVQTAQRPGYPHPITVYNMETEVTSQNQSVLMAYNTK
jgi:hypothetical protein